MTYKEETYLLDRLSEIGDKVHENNVMLRQVCSYIRYACSQRPNDEGKAFEQNVLANIVSEVLDGVRGRLRTNFNKR